MGREVQESQLRNVDTGIDWVSARKTWTPTQEKRDERSIREIYNTLAASLLLELKRTWTFEDISIALDTTESPSDSSGATASFSELSKDLGVQIAEEYICYHNIAFIQNLLARMLTLIISKVCLLVAVFFAISFYPFVPRTQITVWMVMNLLLIGSVVIYVYADMEKNVIPSLITKTTPGKLGSEFWVRSIGFLSGPILGILPTQFPTISDSFLKWLQPAVDAFR